MKFFNSEKDHFFKKVARDFNFKAFWRLIFIRISFESEKWPFSDLKNLMVDDLKIMKI